MSERFQSELLHGLVTSTETAKRMFLERVAPLSPNVHALRASGITPDAGNGNSRTAFGGAHRGQLFRKAKLPRRARLCREAADFHPDVSRYLVNKHLPRRFTTQVSPTAFGGNRR